MTARRGLAAAIALVIAVVLFTQRRRGAAIEHCATQLASAVAASDVDALAELAPSPDLRARLVRGRTAEIAYARPGDAEHSRVGLVVHTGTTAKVYSLLLSNDRLPECSFYRDYEPRGPFGS